MDSPTTPPPTTTMSNVRVLISAAPCSALVAGNRGEVPGEVLRHFGRHLVRNCSDALGVDGGKGVDHLVCESGALHANAIDAQHPRGAAEGHGEGWDVPGDDTAHPDHGPGADRAALMDHRAKPDLSFPPGRWSVRRSSPCN